MRHDSVKLIECPRDAWQGLPRIIPTEMKVRYLRGLISAGFKQIDAVSFVSPRAVPQMADSEEVLTQLDLPDDVEIIGIVVNERGAERALATHKVTTLGFPCSISETFLRRNQNQSPQENFAALEQIKRLADDAKRNVVAYISMAFGNPYGDPWSRRSVVESVEKITELGVCSISLADTIGAAEPELVRRIFAAVRCDCARCDVGVHLHSTRADAAQKILAAYDAGCRRFDSAIGGLGGCPFAQDTLVGNLPTEEVLRALAQRGVTLPVTEVSETLVGLNADIAEKFSA